MQHHIVPATHVEMDPAQLPFLIAVMATEIVQIEVMKPDVLVSFSTDVGQHYDLFDSLKLLTFLLDKELS